MRLGGWEILAVLLVALLIFGPSKLPQLGKSLAQFLKNFKGGFKEVKKEAQEIEDNLRS